MGGSNPEGRRTGIPLAAVLRLGWAATWRFGAVFGMMGVVVWYLGSMPDGPKSFLERWGGAIVAAGALFYYTLLLDNLGRTTVRSIRRVTVTRFMGLSLLRTHLAVTVPILAMEWFFWRSVEGVSLREALFSGGWGRRVLGGAGLAVAVGAGAAWAVGTAVLKVGRSFPEGGDRDG